MAAPTIPTGLQVTASTTSSVSLAWNASTQGSFPISGYRVYRGGTSVGTTSSGVLNFTDSGLGASTHYLYSVSCFDTGSQDSGQSSQIDGTTQTVSSIPLPFTDLIVPV